MPFIRNMSFCKSLNYGKYGYAYDFILTEAISEEQLEVLKGIMQNYLNTLSPIGELQSLPYETVKEIISKYE